LRSIGIDKKEDKRKEAEKVIRNLKRDKKNSLEEINEKKYDLFIYYNNKNGKKIL